MSSALQKPLKKKTKSGAVDRDEERSSGTDSEEDDVGTTGRLFVRNLP
jgi:hypothetical protein